MTKNKQETTLSRATGTAQAPREAAQAGHRAGRTMPGCIAAPLGSPARLSRELITGRSAALARPERRAQDRR
jgi:hypothetical protein